MDFTIGQGDTQPQFCIRLRDPKTKLPFDVTGWTLAFKLWRADGSDMVRTVTGSGVVVEDARAGALLVTVPSTCHGVYLSQVVATKSGSPPSQETFPAGDYYRVEVTPTRNA